MKQSVGFKYAALSFFSAVVLYPIILCLFTGIFFNFDNFFVLNKKGKTVEIIFEGKKPRKWVTLKEVSSKALWAIVISEDWAFYQHSGLDFNQLGKIFEQAVKKGKFKRGASTITQQVVKNLYLSHERSFFRKFNEMILSSVLEVLSNKKWILEQYVNLAKFGPNVFGLKEAAGYYFEKAPIELSYREGAFIAMLLPSPVRYGESFRKSELTVFASSQIESILSKLVDAKIMTEEEKVFELSNTFDWESIAPKVRSF